MVVFVNDPPSAERRIDFAVFFLLFYGLKPGYALLFFSKLASGRNRWQLHLQVCLLFVNEQNPSFSNQFSFKTCAIISIS